MSKAERDIERLGLQMLRKVGAKANSVQTAWIAPTLLNSWVNYGGAYNAAGYFKDSIGIVHFRGMVKSGTIGDVPVFTLPAGYRPAAQNIFICMSYDTGHVIGRCDVKTDGDVWLRSGGNTWFSLDGITFRAV